MRTRDRGLLERRLQRLADKARAASVRLLNVPGGAQGGILTQLAFVDYVTVVLDGHEVEVETDWVLGLEAEGWPVQYNPDEDGIADYDIRLIPSYGGVLATIDLDDLEEDEAKHEVLTFARFFELFSTREIRQIIASLDQIAPNNAPKVKTKSSAVSTGRSQPVDVNPTPEPDEVNYRSHASEAEDWLPGSTPLHEQLR